MFSKSTCLAALLSLLTLTAAQAEGVSAPTPDEMATGNFAVTRSYAVAPEGQASSSISGLVRSLDRARRNGVSGSGQFYRVLSLDQARQEQQWRNSVARRLGSFLSESAQPGQSPGQAQLTF